MSVDSRQLHRRRRQPRQRRLATLSPSTPLNPTVTVDIVDRVAERQRQQLGCDLHLQRGAGRFHGRRHHSRGRHGRRGLTVDRRSAGLHRDLHRDRRLLRHRLGDGRPPAATPTRPATPAPAARTLSPSTPLNPTVTVDIVDRDAERRRQQLGRDLHLQRGAGRFHGRRHHSRGRHGHRPDASTADPLVYTATFTATDGFTGTGSVSVDSRQLHRRDRQPRHRRLATPSPSTRVNPTVTVDIVDRDAERRRQQLGRDLHLQRGAGRFHGRRHHAVGGTVTRPDALDRRSAGLHRDLHRDRRLLPAPARFRSTAGSYTDADRQPRHRRLATTSPSTPLNPTVTVDIVDRDAERRRQQLGGDLHLHRGAGRFHGRRHHAVGGTVTGLTRRPPIRWSTPRPSPRPTASPAPARCRSTAGSYTDATGNPGTGGSRYRHHRHR